jgi:hypothetical protein
MVNWYYVRGNDRVGPVGVDVLRDLFSKQELNLESYVWRKGFQNWERLKDVAELDMSGKGPAEVQEMKQAAASPELEFNFDWKKIRDDEELFFIKIGHDRKNLIDDECFGPYTLSELRDAKEEKRINDKTLIFAAGLSGWIEAGETPLNPLKLNINQHHAPVEVPLLMVLSHEPLPLVALVNKAGTKECTLLGSGPFKTGEELLCSIYSGSRLKAKNVKINIAEYEPKQQRVVCRIIELNEDARKVIQNYA